jgi:hypothetical protein
LRAAGLAGLRAGGARFGRDAVVVLKRTMMALDVSPGPSTQPSFLSAGTRPLFFARTKRPTPTPPRTRAPHTPHARLAGLAPLPDRCPFGAGARCIPPSLALFFFPAAAAAATHNHGGAAAAAVAARRGRPVWVARWWPAAAGRRAGVPGADAGTQGEGGRGIGHRRGRVRGERKRRVPERKVRRPHTAACHGTPGVEGSCVRVLCAGAAPASVGLRARALFLFSAHTAPSGRRPRLSHPTTTTSIPSPPLPIHPHPLSPSLPTNQNHRPPSGKSSTPSASRRPGPARARRTRPRPTCRRSTCGKSSATTAT